ncbi:uncharacterized protein LOC128953639 [Oppia nitens]|uniref:uncharacterized protein LOC128953639 n=1 Tax=Oppia nitens TaxID=1686743 RepID=UPI0023D9FAAA|nr:uncharacterized protein LOC128953639 [Oppia nitens]
MKLLMFFNNSIILIYSIIILLFIEIDQYESAKQLPCNNNTINKVDAIINKINPIGNPDHTFPETLPDAMKSCKQLLKPLTTLDDLNKRCMKGMMKEVVGIVLYSVKKKRRSMCKKSPTAELRELTDSAKCINKGRSGVEKCANKSLDRFMAMKNVDNDLKIPLVCCEIGKTKKCMLDHLSTVDICTDHHKEVLVGHFNGLSGGALKLACNDYQDDSDKCHKLQSVKLNVRSGQNKYKSLVLAVIQLFESIDKN